MNLTTADGRSLSLDRPRIMGILNVTPDSFSDGGQFVDASAAVAHALKMVADGADLIDVGGESTRPGSQPVSVDEQCRRVVGVISQLRQQLDAVTLGKSVVTSIDTTQPIVAAAAIDAGAGLINDVNAGRAPGMLALAAKRQCPIVLMHMQGTPATMQAAPTYSDVVAEVEAFLRERINAAIDAGLPREKVFIDPGIGFGKTKLHNLALLAALPRFTKLGHGVLLGTSRKRFMGSLCSRRDLNGGEPTPPTPDELVGATCATTALGVAAGVRLFRVHDVWANFQAAQTAWAISHGA
jgi:dihydropteroate synthase